MTTPIFIYGAGGHGKVVADIVLARAAGLARGFIDDRHDLIGRIVLGLPVCGDRSWLLAQARADRIAVALGIGDNYSRRQVAEACIAAGVDLPVFIHPTAAVSASAKVGAGTVIMANVTVNPDAVLGKGVIVNSGAVVEHDCTVGDYAHVSPNSTLGGSAALGALSLLGTGAVVLPGVAVGAGTTIGAGGVVVRNLPDRVVAFGVPARVRRPDDHEFSGE